MLVDAFFGRHPGPGRAAPGLGRAVIDFMRWETTSGRLADDVGSPWWRAVNRDLLLDLTEGAEAWLEYANAAPDDAQGRLWHAHQLSITTAATRAAALLDDEPVAEQQFALLVLAIVDDAAGRGTPTDTGLLDALTAKWYPDHYPITEPEVDALRHALSPDSAA